MQLAEQHELIFLLNTRLRFRLIMVVAGILFSLGLLTWLIVSSASLESDLFLFNLIILVIGALGILVEGWILVWLIQKLRAPAPTLRLNHEGMFAHDVFG